jgi:DNA-binding PadR family transcriptional regulator
MKSTQLEFLRNILLMQLAACPQTGAPITTLVVGVQLASFKATSEEIANELSYLEDKGLTARVQKTLSPENVRYRITANGRDFLAQEGLIA